MTGIDTDQQGAFPGDARRDSVFFPGGLRRAARRNAASIPWARERRDDAVRRADRYLAAGVESLWRMVMTQSLPRSYAVNQEAGSPVTGRRLHAFGRYPWRADPLERPWKLEDPSSGYLFPTNDFGAYYESGLGADGLFDPALADRSLLVNTLYPDRGPGWGVDNGFGWHDEAGRTWTFIAYYNHWWLWYRSEDTGISTPVIWDALDALREAWIFTDDARYAHAGLVLLDRVADVYPAMDTSAYARADGFLHSDGLRGAGGVTGSIWETQLVVPLINAYDAFSPLLVVGDPAGVVPFLSAQARRYGMANPKASSDDIRRNIEHGVIRRIHPMVVAGRIRGNFGMHQHALARAAAALADPVDTPEWIAFLNRPGTYGDGPTPRLTGGNVLPALVNDIDRDGFGNEAAPHYNYLWLDQMLGLATTLDAVTEVPGADLFAHSRLRAMLDAWPRLTMIGGYTPTIGDTPKTGNPFVRGAIAHYVAAYQRWGDPLYARFAWLLNGNTADGIRGDVFADAPGEIGEAIADAVREHGPLTWRSDNLTGYGLGILRDHVPGHERSLWLYYGRNRGHGHADTLNLGLHAFGVDLSPDLGYPEYADDNPKRKEWTINTISHNTVIVNGRTQDPVVAGTPLMFLDAPGVQAIEVDAAQAYAETSVYRRASVLVRIDEETSYIVDIVRVHGGDDHHFSFHGAEGPVTVEGLSLGSQEGGSYAGPDIPWGPAPDPATAASGFSWLDRVGRDAAPPSAFGVDWAITDTWGVLPPEADVHLRLTMLGEVDDVALADGYPATNQVGNPERLRYLIAHRHGRDLRSRFVSVIEPYARERRVRAISTLPVASKNGREVDDVTAVRIESVAGRIDTVIHTGDAPGELIVDGRFAVEGRLAVISEHPDGSVSAVLEQGSAVFVDGAPLIDNAVPALTGQVIDFTREMSRNNAITVRFDHMPDLGALPDAGIAIDHDGDRNAAYTIVSATQTGPDAVTLDIGAASPIRAYADPLDMARGFAYDFAPGARFRIPRHHTATR